MAAIRIPGKDGANRPNTLLLEESEDGSHLLFSTPPAGLKLDWHNVDLLIQALGEYRGRMRGDRVV